MVIHKREREFRSHVAMSFIMLRWSAQGLNLLHETINGEVLRLT